MGQSLRKSTFQARAVGAVVFALLSGLSPGCGYRSNFFTASESAVPFELSPVPDGVVWARESVHAIAWDGAPFPPEETGSFAVSRDGGATYAEVAFVQARAGRYLYAVPADGEPRLRLRLTVGRVSRETRDVALVASQRRAYRANRVLAEAPFGPRDGAGALVHSDRMWLIGGWNPERFPRSPANDVWSSEDGVAWRGATGGSPDGARCAEGVVKAMRFPGSGAGLTVTMPVPFRPTPTTGPLEDPRVP